MILVHGRGAGPANILDLADALAHPDFTYLAPAAAGSTWYPFSFMADTASNEPGITSGIQVLASLVEDVVAAGVPQDRIVLAGFSQGACLSCELVARHPARYGALLAFSGGLIGPPGTTWKGDGDLGGMPVFLGCSDRDAHVPRDRVDESAEVFRRMGAEVDERIYPGMGHLINGDEIERARAMVEAVAGPGQR
jgi:predicted esterase